MTAELLLSFIAPCPFSGSPTLKLRSNAVYCSYNKSQQDALFPSFILVKNSTCFGQTYCLSSGVLILYLQQLL